MAKITLIGMYNFDNSLFDGLVLPEGINKEEFVAALLMRDGEFEVLYPDFTFLKGAIGIWSAKWRHTFEKWLIGQNADWNPIENYDRYEEWTDEFKKDSSSTGKATGKDNFKSKGTNEAQKSAYDSASYQPDAKTLADNENDSTSESDTSATGKESGDSKHNAHIHGNIGVTTSAAMLGEFYEISKWNLYDHMADLFKTELLIPIY